MANGALRKDDGMTTERIDDADVGVTPTRRGLLRLGAVAIPAVATMSPAFAQSVKVSALNCQIPVPNSSNQTKWIKADGTLVASKTSGSFPPPASAYTGQQILSLSRPTSMQYYGGVKDLQNNYYVSQNAFNAHVEYIKKLTRGTAGFSCFASVAGRR